MNHVAIRIGTSESVVYTRTVPNELWDAKGLQGS